MFEGFEYPQVNTGDATINLVHGGSGPPLLLIHGYPETHVAWHKVAPLLKDSFTLIMPDLRGYGDSSGPEPDPQHRNYSKRAMAQDMVGVMMSLGYDSFAVAGHDRGARVAYRLTLDHPDRVTQLAVLNIIPTLDTFELMGYKDAISTYHWYFLAQPYPLPEKLIGSDPEFYLRHTVSSWTDNPQPIAPEAMDEYLRCFRKESVINAACEDYRAGASVDIELDREDRDAGNRIQCPVLVLFGEHGSGTTGVPSPLDVWRQWAQNVTGFGLDCGHFLMEEAPEETAEALKNFFQKG